MTNTSVIALLNTKKAELYKKRDRYADYLAKEPTPYSIAALYYWGQQVAIVEQIDLLDDLLIELNK